MADALGYHWRSEDHAALDATDDAFGLVCDAGERQDFDPRPHIKLDNQGSAPSCVGHGLSHCMEALHWIAFDGRTVQFSRMFAWLESQRRCKLYGRRGGATIRAAEEVAREVGLPFEHDMPYSTTYPKFAARKDTRPLNALYDEAYPFRLQRTSTLRSYDDLRNWIGTGQGPVLLGMSWTVGRFNGRKINSYRYSSRAGGHCVFAFGGQWKGGDLWTWCGNSHRDGWALMGPRFWSSWFKHRRNVARGLSDMQSPNPRRIDWSTWSVLA